MGLHDVASANLNEALKNKRRIRAARKELKLVKNTYKLVSIFAPIDGTVISQNVEPSQTVPTDMTLFTLADVLVVVAQLDEIDVGKVSIGNEVKVDTDAFPEESFSGRITRIAYESKVIKNIAYYDITPDLIFDNKMLKSGMTANVEIEYSCDDNVIFVPIKAVFEKDGEHYVIVKSKGGKNEVRKIIVGLRDRSDIQIMSGVKVGEQIVTRTENDGKEWENIRKFKSDHLKYFKK